MAVSVNGLGSGLDITSIVNSLMAVEALPQQQLKQTQTQSGTADGGPADAQHESRQPGHPRDQGRHPGFGQPADGNLEHPDGDGYGRQRGRSRHPRASW